MVLEWSSDYGVASSMSLVEDRRAQSYTAILGEVVIVVIYNYNFDMDTNRWTIIIT